MWGLQASEHQRRQAESCAQDQTLRSVGDGPGDRQTASGHGDDHLRIDTVDVQPREERHRRMPGLLELQQQCGHGAVERPVRGGQSQLEPIPGRGRRGAVGGVAGCRGPARTSC